MVRLNVQVKKIHAFAVAQSSVCKWFKLQKTDITDYALDALSKSRVKRVYMVGRRGPLQTAFTTAELRELLKLPGCRTVFNPADFAGFQNRINGTLLIFLFLLHLIILSLQILTNKLICRFILFSIVNTLFGYHMMNPLPTFLLQFLELYSLS